MTGNEGMDDAERAAPTGRSAAFGLHASARPRIGRTPDRQPAEAARGATGLDARPSARSTGYLCGLLPDLNCGLLAQPATRAARGTRGPELSRPRHFPRRGPLGKDASAKGAIRRRFAVCLALAPADLPLRFAPLQASGKALLRERAPIPSTAFPGACSASGMRPGTQRKTLPRSGAELIRRGLRKGCVGLHRISDAAHRPAAERHGRALTSTRAPGVRDLPVLRRGGASDADRSDELAVDEDRHAALIGRGAAQAERAHADAAAAERDGPGHRFRTHATLRLRRVSVHRRASRPYPFTSAMTVVAIRIAAKRRLTIRDATGSRSTRDSAAPAKSQNRWMTTIMIVSTADLSSASTRRGSTASVVPANTAAIAR